MDDTVIKVEHLSKIYKLYDRPIDRLKESVNPLKKSYHKDFYALNDISFEIKKGETVGIIGKNGSGKSTLLKILTGVLTPSTGIIDVKGKISALLELGAGFNLDYTGIENIYFNGMVMGYSKEEMDEKVDDILSFADIGDFAKQPVKSYSSGMFVRLAFALATIVEPEILIVDEALSVGDMYFQAKSMKKMKSIIEKGSTILFVSHDMSAVKSLCNMCIHLDKGKLKAYGSSGEICNLYIGEQMDSIGYFKLNETQEKIIDQKNDQIDKSEPKFKNINELSLDKFYSVGYLDVFKKNAEYFRQGSGDARIIYSYLTDEKGNPTSEIYFAQKVILKVFYKSSINLDQLVIAFYIKDKNQLELIGTNNVYENSPIKDIHKENTYCTEFHFVNYLRAGSYSTNIIMADDINSTVFYDWIDNVVLFKSTDLPNQIRWSLVGIPVTVDNFIVNENMIEGV